MSSPREFVAEILVSERVPPVPPAPVEALLEAAEHEGVTALLAWTLFSAGTSDAWVSDLKEALHGPARIAMATEMWRRHALVQIAQAFAAAGTQCLLLKGPANADWLYPNPALRASSDLDFLFRSREEALGAAKQLETLGYRLPFVPGDGVGEVTARAAGSRPMPELDLHWRLVDTPAYGCIFDFSELWADSVPISDLPTTAVRRLGDLHSLVHACLHRAHDLGLHRPDRLKWLFEIHLMLSRLDDVQRAAWIALIGERNLAAVSARSVEDSIRIFHTRLPAETTAAIASLAAHDTLDVARLSDWRYMQWKSMNAIPTFKGRVEWLRARLFPSKGQLQELYGTGSTSSLMIKRVKRALMRIFGFA